MTDEIERLACEARNDAAEIKCLMDELVTAMAILGLGELQQRFADARERARRITKATERIRRVNWKR